MADDNPQRPDADAVSLHTITERDLYASQEQEDADLALALSLEEEEENRAHEVAQNIKQAQEREALIARERGGELSHQRITPYRDDPNDDDALAQQPGYVEPYFDDPEAAIVDTEARSDPPVISGRVRGCIGTCARRTADYAQRLVSWRPIIPKRTIWIVAIALVLVAGLVSVTIVGGSRNSAKSGPTSKQLAFDSSGSKDDDLVLQKLYPELEDGTSRYCSNAWKELEGLNCHRAILSSIWDQGNGEEIRQGKMDIWAYSRPVCDVDDRRRTCERALRNFREKLTKACVRRTDRFNLRDYKKRSLRYFEDEEINEGPLQAVQGLEARYANLCARPTTELWGAPIEWGTYAAELWMRWGIADGKDADTNLQYLETFINATNEQKTIKGHIQRGFVETQTGTVPYEVEVLTRKVGPGEGETSCGYSIRSWLERKWRSFEYGIVLDPQIGSPMGLAAFNKLMETAIKRCEKFEAGQMIRRRHEMWEQYGWWCEGGPCHEDKPVSDVVLRLLNGLSMGDSPLPSLRKIMDMEDVPRDALRILHDSLFSMPCNIWMASDQWMTHIASSDFLMRRLCSNECRNSVDRIQLEHGSKFEEASKTYWEVLCLAIGRASGQ